ncbi:MAG: acyl-CoA N-acyltransferase [Candidatus Nomurabacteria bacterium]|nr:acyl-CoA N-acyltransferase [Candidatus Nomurabacteria bacterium]
MINIRLATLEDLSILQTLNDEVFVDNAKYDSDLNLNWSKGEKGRKYFSDILVNQDVFKVIAEDGGKAIGYLTAIEKLIDYRKSKYLEIENMGVIPEYRSKGIGKQLMEECFIWGKQNGYQKVFVNTYIANEKALKFYKKNGFNEIDISLEKIL